MSAVERAGYFDNQLSAIVHETIVKEKKVQRANLQKQEAAGTIKPYHAPPQPQTQTLAQSVGLPPYMATLSQDPIQQMNTSISKHMWTSNPGYLVRDGLHMTSRFKQDFTWDQEEIEYMKSQGFLNQTHNRRRDEYTQYVEVAAKSRALIGKKAAE